jgi:hypothetical protein
VFARRPVLAVGVVRLRLAGDRMLPVNSWSPVHRALHQHQEGSEMNVSTVDQQHASGTST